MAIKAMPTKPRLITISEVEQVADANLTHTPMMAKTNVANNIHNDCMRSRFVANKLCLVMEESAGWSSGLSCKHQVVYKLT
jgi:hypothetical protein